MNYFPQHASDADTVLKSPELGYISRYALGRDYHKLMRKRLQKLATRIENEIGPFGYRAFVDSAPVSHHQGDRWIAAKGQAKGAVAVEQVPVAVPGSG